MAEEAFRQVVRVTYPIQEPEDIKCLETQRAMNKYGKIRAVVIQSGGDKERASLVSELNRFKIELADHLLPQPGKKRQTPPGSQAEVMESIVVAENAIL